MIYYFIIFIANTFNNCCNNVQNIISDIPSGFCVMLSLYCYPEFKWVYVNSSLFEICIVIFKLNYNNRLLPLVSNNKTKQNYIS